MHSSEKTSSWRIARTQPSIRDSLSKDFQCFQRVQTIFALLILEWQEITSIKCRHIDHMDIRQNAHQICEIQPSHGSWRELTFVTGARLNLFIEAIQEIPRNSKGVSDRQISFKAMHQVICQFCFTHFAAIVNIPSSALRNRPQAAAASCTALAGSACQVTCHGGTCTHLFNKVCVISYIYCN